MAFLAAGISLTMGGATNEFPPKEGQPILKPSDVKGLLFTLPDHLDDDDPLPPYIISDMYFIYRLPSALSNAGINITFVHGSSTANTSRKAQYYTYSLNTNDIPILIEKTGELLKQRVREVYPPRRGGSIANVVPYFSSNLTGSIIYEICYRPPTNYMLKVIIIEDTCQPAGSGYPPQGVGSPDP